MNKLRINLKKGVSSWSFVLYDSAESAYYLKDEPVYDDSVDEEYRKVITLTPGDSMEVEWVGSEWVYDDVDGDDSPSTISTSPNEKFDKVRVGKLTPVEGDPYRSGYLEVYSGWLISSQVSLFREATQKMIRITPIKGRIRSKFDFSKIFLEQKLDDSEPETREPKSGPAVVN